MILLLKQNGQMVDMTKYSPGKEPPLVQLKNWIGGGFIEIVHILWMEQSAQMICDSDFHRKHHESGGKKFQYNAIASALYIATACRNGFNPLVVFRQNPIFGDVVLLTEENKLT